jgi:hypothetical protein
MLYKTPLDQQSLQAFVSHDREKYLDGCGGPHVPAIPALGRLRPNDLKANLHYIHSEFPDQPWLLSETTSQKNPPPQKTNK